MQEIPSMVGPSRRRPPRQRAKTVNAIEGQKRCPKCEVTKPITEFGVARDRADGLSGHCASCRAAERRATRASDPERYRADTRARYAANPEQWKAKVAASRAIARGLIAKPAPGTPCPECRRVLRLEAHHHLGYAKEHWLDVKWACRSCHATRHAEQRMDQDGV